MLTQAIGKSRSRKANVAQYDDSTYANQKSESIYRCVLPVKLNLNEKLSLLVKAIHGNSMDLYIDIVRNRLAYLIPLAVVLPTNHKQPENKPSLKSPIDKQLEWIMNMEHALESETSV